MKQGWIEKIQARSFRVWRNGGFVLVCDSIDAVKLLRQRDAMWKRAVKRLKAKQQSVDAIEALDDLIAAMKCHNRRRGHENRL